MNSKNIIEAYLASKGIFPAKRYRNYSIYHAPYRADRTPSLKVQSEQWYDFGISEGGGLHQLKQKMGEVVEPFEYQPVSASVNAASADSNMRINYTKDIGSNRVLNQYLESRGISIPIAQQYCKEVYYSAYEKKFFAIGLPTVNPDSFALSNRDFKGNLGSGESFFSNGFNAKELLVFEGCFSMLSYWQLFKTSQNLSRADVLVLNSLSNKNKFAQYAGKYQCINLYLDNDLAGKSATKELLSKHDNMKDQSALYAKTNDLNDYLQEKNDMISSVKFGRR